MSRRILRILKGFKKVQRCPKEYNGILIYQEGPRRVQRFLECPEEFNRVQWIKRGQMGLDGYRVVQSYSEWSRVFQVDLELSSERVQIC